MKIHYCHENSSAVDLTSSNVRSFLLSFSYAFARIPFGLPPRSMQLSSDPTVHTRSSHLILISGGQYSTGSF